MTALYFLVNTAAEILIWLLIIYVVLGWLVSFNVVNTSNRFVYSLGQGLSQLLEPMLRPIRNLLPGMGGLDFSPIIFAVAVHFVRLLLLDSVFPAIFG